MGPCGDYYVCSEEVIERSVVTPGGYLHPSMGSSDYRVLQRRGGAHETSSPARKTEGDGPTSFVTILKNCRSLCSEERFEEVFTEMRDVPWDAILCNETRRAANEEFDHLHNGHLWLGSGGTAGKHGVGILLHERWANCVHRWRAISPRLAVLELNTGRLKLSLAVVYMPHCGYQDIAVEEIYQKLSLITRESRSRKRLLIIAGDWNAEVKSEILDRCKHDVVGKYANMPAAIG